VLAVLVDQQNLLNKFKSHLKVADFLVCSLCQECCDVFRDEVLDASNHGTKVLMTKASVDVIRFPCNDVKHLGVEFPHFGRDCLTVVHDDGHAVEAVFDGIKTVGSQPVHQNWEDHFLKVSEDFRFFVNSFEESPDRGDATNCSECRFSIIFLNINLDKTLVLGDQLSSNLRGVGTHIVLVN